MGPQAVMECPSSSSKVLSAIPASGGLPALLHCMPTFVEYAFYEGSRASVDIQPVAALVGIGLALVVLLMDVEAYMAWSKLTYSQVGEVSNTPVKRPRA